MRFDVVDCHLLFFQNEMFSKPFTSHLQSWLSHFNFVSSGGVMRTICSSTPASHRLQHGKNPSHLSCCDNKYCWHCSFCHSVSLLQTLKSLLFFKCSRFSLHVLEVMFLCYHLVVKMNISFSEEKKLINETKHSVYLETNVSPPTKSPWRHFIPVLVWWFFCERSVPPTLFFVFEQCFNVSMLL